MQRTPTSRSGTVWLNEHHGLEPYCSQNHLENSPGNILNTDQKKKKIREWLSNMVARDHRGSVSTFCPDSDSV